jgi:Protein of unknown function (DUF742)
MAPDGEESRGALVRPYAVTRGRTEPQHDIAIEAILMTTVRGGHEAWYAGHDKNMIASLCYGQAQSLAEIAARTRLPLGVTRILVDDMVTDGLLALHAPATDDGDDHLVLLERVLSGLRRL